MMRSNRAIESAVEVFVHGHSAGMSRTFPYEVSRVGPLWLMRDADRKNPRDYRKDDHAHGSKCSVLTATHTGAHLHLRVGYERIGTLFMFAPTRG